MVHTGPGKGKSTAGFGLVLRALGHGWKVGVVQFGKGAWQSGERTILEQLGEARVSWHTLGEGFTWETQDRARDEAAARRAWEKARELMADPELRLLMLEAVIQGYLAKGRLSVGHAKVLLGVEDPAKRAILARRVIEDELSVRVLEKLALGHKTSRTGRRSGRAVPAGEAAAVADIEKRLTTHLGARVSLQHSPKRGRIVIEYAGNEDLQRILEKLGMTA